MLKQTKKAFTLVELIIVITILAILATIGFMSYQSYTADARNSKRTNDLSALQSKIEVLVAKTTVTDITTFASGNTNPITTTGTNTVGSGTTLTGGTNYSAGLLNYTTFGIAKSDFSDPSYNGTTSTGNYLVAGVKSTNRGALYQLAATLEASDGVKKTLINGLFLTGGTDTALGLIKGVGGLTNSGLTNGGTTDFPY
ncbi:MAG: prepilin-type N-terminal cleavage/methylation domain-containing protein [Candidatus Gracilibacteria bacterium]|nr:prepilin-type N-terminal cleavage/methylation domain-containing protein [Candidatus Gracilibacteria bacterium]